MAAPGLRQRKKERTRATITRVALELFVRDGFAATTVNAIAEAADVAPRTVSTYFPSKEGIVFWGYGPSFDRLAARLAARAPGEPVVDAVGAWMRGEDEQPFDWSNPMVRRANEVEGVDFARLRAMAIERDPELLGIQRRVLREVEDLVAAAAADEVGDALAARLLGATTLAALLELNAEAARGQHGTIDGLDRVLAFLHAGAFALGK